MPLVEPVTTAVLPLRLAIEKSLPDVFGVGTTVTVLVLKTKPRPDRGFVD
jgi:hypothetical protein